MKPNLKDYIEFCEIFNGLSAEQAKNKADELGLSYEYYEDGELIDINFKNICATICCTGMVSDSYESWNGTDYEVVLI